MLGNFRDGEFQGISGTDYEMGISGTDYEIGARRGGRGDGRWAAAGMGGLLRRFVGDF